MTPQDVCRHQSRTHLGHILDGRPLPTPPVFAQIKGTCGSAKGFLELVLHNSADPQSAHNKELIEAAISQLQKTINWSHHREVAHACVPRHSWRSHIDTTHRT